YLFVCSVTFLFLCSGDHRDLHSFPTRRSSDLRSGVGSLFFEPIKVPVISFKGLPLPSRTGLASIITKSLSLSSNFQSSLIYSKEDRKSTRLNSSHVKISYAVFCLKKKKKKIIM